MKDLLTIALRKVAAAHPNMPAPERGKLAAKLALETARELRSEHAPKTRRMPVVTTVPAMQGGATQSAEQSALARRMGVRAAGGQQLTTKKIGARHFIGVEPDFTGNVEGGSDHE